MKLLLALTQRYLPSTKAEWEAVAEAYNASRDAKSKPRDAISLKRKLRSMGKAAHTDSKYSRTARQVQLMAKPRTTATHSSQMLNSPTKADVTATASIRYTADEADKADAPCCSACKLRENALNRHQQLQDLFQQRESDRRAARRHYNEIVRSLALLKCTMESFSLAMDTWISRTK